MRQYFFILNLLVISLGLSGCSAIIGHGLPLMQYEQELRQNSNSCSYHIVNQQIKSDPLLWNLLGGSQALHCRDYKKSIFYFDQAEALVKQQEEMILTQQFGQKLATIAVNNNINAYSSRNYDKIMLNVYKGLSFMALHDPVNARIEFNRALDRQRRAKEYFDAEIKQLQQAINQRHQTVDAQSAASITQEILTQQQPTYNLPERAYQNFINPFATYISALFFYLDGDYGKAETLLRELKRAFPNNQPISDDLQLVQRPKRQHYIWLIYENGTAATLKQRLYSYPSFLLSRRVLSVNLALPYLMPGHLAYPRLLLNQKPTVEIANIDNIIAAEFQKRYPTIVSEAVSSAIAKATLQYTLSQKPDQQGMQLLALLYQSLTTQADIRSWRALPKSFQVARVANQGQKVTIYDDQQQIIHQFTPSSAKKDVVIYIQAPTRNNPIIQLLSNP